MMSNKRQNGLAIETKSLSNEYPCRMEKKAIWIVLKEY